MKPALQLRQSQQLTLTPQLQQAIRLLHLSTLEVTQEVERLLAENPLMERDEEETVQETYSPPNESAVPASNTDSSPSKDDAPAPEREDRESREDDWAELSFNSTGSPDDEDEPRREIADHTPSLREHLLWQLNMSPLDAHDKSLVGLLIEALDDNGYLSQPLDEILAMLPAELNLTLEDLEIALAQLQHLDEPGFGARDLSECLSLQLKALPLDTDGRALALRVVGQHLPLLAGRDFAKLKKALHCDDDALRVAQVLIMQLKPKPGAAFAPRAADYVVPDVVVERHHGVWRARLNQEAMPRLRVNQMYASILKQGNVGSGQNMSAQLQEARWFIKNLQQRFDTILRVSQAIVERQRMFFEHGETAMRPLVLREIAEQLELHESTISRVTTQKFMLTPAGIYELKYFFGGGIATPTGGACSSTAIRALIKQLVGEEDKKSPLSDGRLSEILAQQGIVVARRTVAKYREQLNILPVNLRKSL
jgi:RNA polymerase sigma-54 factor